MAVQSGAAVTAAGRCIDGCAGWLILAWIHLYWFVVPRRWRRTCLFRTSCSRYVYAAARTKGLTAGLIAAASRRRRCRGGFHVELHEGGWQVHLADGTLADNEELADVVLAPYREALASAHRVALTRAGRGGSDGDVSELRS